MLEITESQYKPSIVFHPGETLSEKLKEMGMGIKEFALRTSKPEKTIIAVIHGESAITPEMAVGFENVTRIPAHYWMNLQRAYDEYKARKKFEQNAHENEEWARKFPIAEMSRKGWISACKNAEETVQQLLLFFGVSTTQAWENYYLNQKLRVAFRLSLASTKDPYAISAWLRKGDWQAMEMQTKAEYSEKILKKNLSRLRWAITDYRVDFLQRLQTICSESGIKIIFTPCISKAPISGATRWISGVPCIQLSGRYKRYDIFCFNLMHEIGHILLHGKKGVFIEDIEYSDRQEDKEKEADEFASEFLLPSAKEAEIIKSGNYSESEIKKYARRYQIHPAIIAGRLQHNKIINWNKDNGLIPMLNLPYN
jgi:HTH-type transcriptional regulator/antitoxin HigA